MLGLKEYSDVTAFPISGILGVKCWIEVWWCCPIVCVLDRCSTAIVFVTRAWNFWGEIPTDAWVSLNGGIWMLWISYKIPGKFRERSIVTDLDQLSRTHISYKKDIQTRVCMNFTLFTLFFCLEREICWYMTNFPLIFLYNWEKHLIFLFIWKNGVEPTKPVFGVKAWM